MFLLSEIYQYNLLQLFYEFKNPQTLDFLNKYYESISKKNYKLLKHSLIEKTKKIMDEIYKEMILADHLHDSYCFCCNRRPKVMQTGLYLYLVCPVCQEYDQIRTGFEKVSLTLNPNNPSIKEADELIVSKIDNVNLDVYLLNFHNECQNLNINKNIKYILDENVDLQENTKRILKI